MTAHRGEFNSRLGFILAAAGSAVGLGNIWKFPFEVGNGGGAAFVLMYLMFCFLLCFPVMVSNPVVLQWKLPLVEKPEEMLWGLLKP